MVCPAPQETAPRPGWHQCPVWAASTRASRQLFRTFVCRGRSLCWQEQLHAWPPPRAPAHAPWCGGCTPVSVRTPELHQHFAFGECASLLAPACGGTSGCCGRAGSGSAGSLPRRAQAPSRSHAGFPHVPVGAEQKVLPLWAVAVQTARVI